MKYRLFEFTPDAGNTPGHGERISDRVFDSVFAAVQQSLEACRETSPDWPRMCYVLDQNDKLVASITPVSCPTDVREWSHWSVADASDSGIGQSLWRQRYVLDDAGKYLATDTELF
jgi:hypothetical protein